MRSALLICLLALLALPATAGAVPNQERHPLSIGHVDAVAPKLEGGELTLAINDDSGAEPVERDPADVLLHAKPEAEIQIPDMPAWSFLGEAGETTYYLPQTQNPDLLWPGWSSESIGSGELAGDQLTWRLLSVDGPGRFHLFSEGVFGDPIPHLSAEDGWPTSQAMGAGVHAHYSWTFSEPGLYKLVFEVSGTRADGTPVTTGPVEYRAFAGDLADLPQDTDLTVAGLQASYAVGDTVALSAVQDPEIGLDHYHWFTRCGGATEWSIVSGAAEATWSFPAALGHDGCEVQARLYGHAHEVVAASAPVTLRVVAPQPPVGGGGGGTPTTEIPAPAPGEGPAPAPQPPAPPPGFGSPSGEPVPVGASVTRRPAALRRLARTGTARLTCTLDGPGTCVVRAWVGRRAARTLGLPVPQGAERVQVGRGRAQRTSAGRVRVRVKLGRRAKAALREADEPVRLRVTATAR